MRQPIKHHTIALVLALVLGACSAFNLGDANRLQRGMTPTQVEALVSKGPRTTVDLALGSTAAEYYAVFRNGKLLYWGHPYEFNRHPDASINAIGAAAVAATD